MTLPTTSAWQMEYSGWHPDQQAYREALCTLGNGRFSTRGAFEGSSADGVHYPGSYMGGGYNRRTSVVAERDVVNEDLVNLPNWLVLNFKPEGGEWFDFAAVEWLDFKQTLDIRDGLLTYALHFRDPQGRETRLTSRRIVHMGDSHLAAIEWELEPINWSGGVVLRSGIDGGVENLGVARYRQLETRHLEVLAAAECAEDSVLLRSVTNQSRIDLAHAARTRLYRETGEPLLGVEREVVEKDGFIGHHLHLVCRQGQRLKVEKVAAFFSGRDRAITEPGLEAETAVQRAGRFAELLVSHRQAWARYWRWWDIELQTEVKAETQEQLVLRLHIFHLLQTTSLHIIDLDVGVPARGLHGEAYRGHIFWDELFIFPSLNLHMPEITRALLLYRYRRLPEARWAAQQEGLRGAMYPWQSGSNGREESQVVHLNPQSGRWLPDETYKQRHINAALAHNVWRYYEVTGDTEFMAFAGVEMLLSIAQFWASLASFSDEKQRYEIRGIVGPDEFHTAYPGATESGLNNNAYTNAMASWCLRAAQRALELLAPTQRDELLERLAIDAAQCVRWDEISRRMFIPFHDGDIISQFEGYEALEELDWGGFEKRHGSVQRLDRLLESEGVDINRYKASKQADVLMLFFLFSTEQIEALFRHMGYPFSPQMIRRNVDYYEARTSHGSTLSTIVHSWVLARSDRQRSWELFGNALLSDLGDVQGGTTGEGIHLGAMAGTVDLVLRGYSGLELRDGVLWLNPLLPDGLRQVEQKIHYRGHWITVLVNHVRLVVRLEEGPAPPVQIGYRGEVYTLEQGQSKELLYAES